MKVRNISIPYDWQNIDMDNDIIKISVEVEDGNIYQLSFATPKYVQFLMDKKKNFFGPGYPLIFVNKLTPEIIEQAVKAFAEEAGSYWLKVYHFAGSGGVIDESIFAQLKAKHIEEQEKLDELDELNFMGQAKLTLGDPVNQTDILYLLDQYRSGNTNPGIGTRVIPGTCISELRTLRGASLYLQEKNDIIEVVAICDKNSRRLVIATLKLEYQKKNNF